MVKVFHQERIKVVWTPYFRTMTVFRNKHRWDDKNIEETTRLSTFDGATQDVEIKILTSPQLIKTIEVLCKTISNHVWEVSGQTTQISIMTLYLQRTDSESVCKLLFCTQLKARRLAPHKIDKRKLNLGKPVMYEPKFTACEEIQEDYHKAVLQKIKIKSHKQGFFKSAASLQENLKKSKLQKKESIAKEQVPLVKTCQKMNCSVCLGRYFINRRNCGFLSNNHTRAH